MSQKTKKTVGTKRNKNVGTKQRVNVVIDASKRLSASPSGLLFTALGLAIATATFYFSFVHKTRALYFSASNANVSMTGGGVGDSLLLSNIGNTPVTISNIYAEIVAARNPDYPEGHNPYSVKSVPDGTKKWQPLLTSPVVVNPGSMYSNTVVICMLDPFFIQSEQNIALRIDIVDYLGNKFRSTFPLDTIKWSTGYAGSQRRVIGYTNVVIPVEQGAFDLFERSKPVGIESVSSGEFGRFDCFDNANPPGMTKPPIS